MARDFLSDLRAALAAAPTFDAAQREAVRRLRGIPGYDWVGIYVVEGEALVLGAWDGPEATEHVRIPIGRGVCGAAAASGRSIVVADVRADPRYLQCFVRTRSEIVVPVLQGTRVLGEIDVDGDEPGRFREADRLLLEAVAADLGRAWARTRRAGAAGTSHEGVRPVVPPLFDSLTYEFEDAAAAERFAADESAGWEYSREGNPTVRAVERDLARLEDAEEARLAASGMGAIAAVALALAGAGKRIVHAPGPYGGTHGLFYGVLPRFGVTAVAAGPDPGSFAEALEAADVAFAYAETVANPLLHVPDLEALAAAARSCGVPLVVDNTLATPFHVRPIERGATIVVESASKALGGHADLLAGVYAGPRDLVERIDRETARYAGMAPSARDAHLLRRGLATFPLRAARQSASAAEVAARLRPLAADGRIARLVYPGFGALLTLDLGSLERARRFYDALEVVRRAASLGAVESLASLPLLSSHRNVPAAERAALGITDGLVRVSIGLEDPAAILADLERAVGFAGRMRE